jgi:4-hydroxy-2-oxoheptanedioate aldolase
MKTQLTESCFRGDMHEGKPQIGIRSQLCSPLGAEALGWCGYDYVYLDMEHAANDLQSILLQSQVLAGTPSYPVVRLPTLDTVLIQQLLDQGIENIVVPMVETVEEARAAVTATRYPPRGIRSSARGVRGDGFGSKRDYAARIDERICLIVQAESRKALDAIDAIAAVDGVHGVLIGPADLAADLGHLGDASHPDVVARISGAIGRIRAAGTFAGMSTNDGASGRKWVEKGCLFVSVGTDLKMLVEQARRTACEAACA